MSTLKSDGIQPTLNTNNLIIRSGADVERLRIQPNGQILVASTTGTTFAGEVNFSNTVRLSGGVQVGGGIGSTRFTALDVVHTNAALGIPDAVNYNTTRSRSNMMIQASGTNTTLFFGNNSSTSSWLQVQNSDNNVYGLALQPVGGNVGIGVSAPNETLHINGNFRIGNAVMSTPSGTAPLFGARAWVVFETNKNTAGTAENPLTTTDRFIQASGNVSSVTRDSVGVYKITFAQPMPDTNYIIIATSATNFNNITNVAQTPSGSVGTSSGYSDSINPLQPYSKTTTSCYIVVGSSSTGTKSDSYASPVSAIIFR